MTIKLHSLMLGVAVAAMAAAGPALAGGDVIYQGIKDAAAVPVPAPIPVADYQPEYYIRLDVGGSWLADGTIDEFSTPLDVKSPDEVSQIEFGSIGMGRYITPSIRVELAVGLFDKEQIQKQNVNYFTTTRTAVGPDFDNGVTTVPTFDTNNYNVERRETIKMEQDLGMLNAYYDIRTGTRFTPYVGGGIGVTYRQLTRNATETAECFRTDNSNPILDATYPTNVCAVDTEDLPAEFTTESETKVNRWDIAAAAMAGLAIEVTDDIIWDTGYRYLWQNGGMSLTSPTITGTSTVEVKDITQHQVRTGIRININ